MMAIDFIWYGLQGTDLVHHAEGFAQENTDDTGA